MSTVRTEPRHWRVHKDDDGIVWLEVDKADSGTNVLSRDVLVELAIVLDSLKTSMPRAVAVASAKTSGFVAGADIDEFVGLETPDQAYGLILAGQQTMDMLADLPCPTVALINGFALGGGLELALACDYRVCNEKARLGLPEVQLGIHPGFGGTVRTVNLTGVRAAMDMMLTGRMLRPDQALKIGLVDRVVADDVLRETGSQLALNAPARHSAGLTDRLLGLTPVRGFVAKSMEQRVARKAKREHYPAPFAIVELWRRYGASGEKAYEAEARSIAELMCTETSRNLVRVFSLQDKLKGLGRGKYPFGHVHVIGAGVMGGDIATWCVHRGMEVTLQDREEKYITPALDRARAFFEKKLKSPDQIDDAMGRIRADVEGSGVADADVVIEAIFENVDAKQDLYRQLEPKLKADAILATNTSSLKLENLRTTLSDPDRLIGLHFFNPVAKMPLVEVVHTDANDPELVKRGLAFVRRLNKLPLPTASAPGFLVNRVLMPYMLEAALIAEDGVPLPLIDKVATDFGMPMGPVELTDTVGLDVAVNVANVLSEAFGLPVPGSLVELVEQKRLGRKSGHGFYEWRDGKAVKPDVTGSVPDGLQDRLILPMINECVAAWREGVVDDTGLLDAGVIFGTGFAPFRGGPLNYARHRGVADIVAALNRLSEEYGERFKPDSGWDALPTG